MNPRDLLKVYFDRGYQLKPVPVGMNHPIIKGWPDREFSPADFGDGANVAIR
jgi:hypothetical protein